MQFSGSFRDFPSCHGIGEVNVSDEKIKRLSLPKPLQRPGPGGGLQYRPSFVPEHVGDVLTHEPIILDNQGRQADRRISHGLFYRLIRNESFVLKRDVGAIVPGNT